MTDIKFDVDINGISEQFKQMKEQIQKDLTKGVESLAVMSHAKLHELAKDNLKSTAKLYRDNIEFSNPESGLWVVTLKAPAVFIDDGLQSHSMVDDLLKKGAKISRDGSKYRVIPFEHSKPSSQQTPKAQELVSQIKQELKSRKINWKKIEYNADGSPRTGRLHSFSIDSEKPSARAKTNALQNVAIYQTKKEDGSVSRDVMTFRVVSDKHKEEGLWVHPGLPAKNLMEKTMEWLETTWEKEILPSILSDYK